MMVCRCVLIAFTGLSSVSILAALQVRAQSKAGPEAGGRPVNKVVSKAGLQASAPSRQLGVSMEFPIGEVSGGIRGKVLDEQRADVPGALIILTNVNTREQYTLASGPNGEFTFPNVPPGTYSLLVNAEGFSAYTSPQFTLSARQIYEVPSIELSIAIQKQEVTVRPTEVIAQMQIKAQEEQRLLGFIPDFHTSYVWNAAPLNTKQKFSLTTHEFFDPVSLIGVGATAGIEQANNSFAGYGQGAAGYGKRFAAELGNDLLTSYLGEAVFPSIFHQDPRYFYQGSGSVKSRLWHALSWAVIARSDSGHPMANYSYLLGDLTAGAVSNLYYPRANRGAGLVLANFAIGVAARTGKAVLREFILKGLTKNVPGDGRP
jgi:Carboxypeptidase regulatory-like domain